MAKPSTRQGLIDYCLRQLGAPVLEINVADEQIDDLVDDAIQYFNERHYDGVEKMYLKYKISDADINRGRAKNTSGVGIVTTTGTLTLAGAITETSDLVPGSSYINGSYTNVPLTGGGGSDATANIIVSSGAISEVTILNTGYGYDLNDILSASAANLGGSAAASAGINTGGSGYTNGSYINVSLTNITSNGSGATGNITVINGSITSITIGLQGSGYEIGDTLGIGTDTLLGNTSRSYSVDDVTSQGDYYFGGSITGSDPTITVRKGDSLSFDVNAPGNPFYIVTQIGIGTIFDSQYNVSEVVNNGTSLGNILWSPTTAGTYYYVSGTNSDLQGEIIVQETEVGSGAVFTITELLTGSGFSLKVSNISPGNAVLGATEEKSRFDFYETSNFIQVPDSVVGIEKIFKFDTSSISGGMFSIKYQLFLNDLYYFNSVELLQYAMVKTYLEDIDHLLTTDKQIRFNKRQNRLYLDIDWGSESADNWLIIECYRALDPADFSKVYNDSFVKKYLTALIKRQWGQNLIKFQGVKLPGGIELNGRQIYDDAERELQDIKQRMTLEYEMPPLDMIG